ncbi:MAG TPA: hypothetical protein VF719_09490 [Abditibacteriaceae bacterium]
MPHEFPPTTLALPPNPLLDKARSIARTAHERGARALLVGGYVRDALLGLSPKDADLEVYQIEPSDLRQLLGRFGRVNCVGESFRVYKLAWHQGDERFELDVSIPRRDQKTGSGHRGFEVEGDPNASFEDAARRRDFTLNAILCDPLNGEIIDPFGGRADLEKKTLRAVDAAHFAEDSLRVLRAMQFAARFGLEIAPETVALCRTIDLSDLPRERIWAEWEKMLLKAARPSVGLVAARELEILAKLFPYFLPAVGERFSALCARLDSAADVIASTGNFSDERRITMLLAATGALIGAVNLEKWLDDFGLKTLNGYPVREQAMILTKNLVHPERAFLSPDATDGEWRRVAFRGEAAMNYALARAFGFDGAELFKRRTQELGVWDGPPAPLLMGRHLVEMGLKPGPRIGEITRAVYEMQLDGVVTNGDEALDAAQTLIDED